MLGRLSREPEGSSGYRFVVLLGCFALLMGALGLAMSSYEGDLPLNLGILFAGAMNVSLGTAELVTRGRTLLAALLRVTALLLGLVTVVFIVAGLWAMFV